MIGAIAAILTTTAFVPQTIKIIKTKETSGLSLGMYTMQVAGVFMWLVHGLMIKDIPLIGANAITLVLSSIILYNIITGNKKNT